MKKPTSTHTAYWDEHFPLDERERSLDEVDPAWAAFARRTRTNLNHRRDPTGDRESVTCQGLREVSDMLQALGDAYANGQKTAVFDALVLAASEGVPLPYWLANAVCQWPDTLSHIGEDDAKPPNLHVVLGLQGRYPLSHDAARKKQAHRAQGMELARRVAKLVSSGLSETPARAQAAKELGVPKSTAANRIAEYLDAESRSPWTPVLAERRDRWEHHTPAQTVHKIKK